MPVELAHLPSSPSSPARRALMAIPQSGSPRPSLSRSANLAFHSESQQVSMAAASPVGLQSGRPSFGMVRQLSSPLTLDVQGSLSPSSSSAPRQLLSSMAPEAVSPERRSVLLPQGLGSPSPRHSVGSFSPSTVPTEEPRQGSEFDAEEEHVKRALAYLQMQEQQPCTSTVEDAPRLLVLVSERRLMLSNALKAWSAVVRGHAAERSQRLAQHKEAVALCTANQFLAFRVMVEWRAIALKGHRAEQAKCYRQARTVALESALRVVTARAKASSEVIVVRAWSMWRMETLRMHHRPFERSNKNLGVCGSLRSAASYRVLKQMVGELVATTESLPD